MHFTVCLTKLSRVIARLYCIYFLTFGSLITEPDAETFHHLWVITKPTSSFLRRWTVFFKVLGVWTAGGWRGATSARSETLCTEPPRPEGTVLARPARSRRILPSISSPGSSYNRDKFYKRLDMKLNFQQEKPILKKNQSTHRRDRAYKNRPQRGL